MNTISHGNDVDSDEGRRKTMSRVEQDLDNDADIITSSSRRISSPAIKPLPSTWHKVGGAKKMDPTQRRNCHDDERNVDDANEDAVVVTTSMCDVDNDDNIITDAVDHHGFVAGDKPSLRRMVRTT